MLQNLRRAENEVMRLTENLLLPSIKFRRLLSQWHCKISADNTMRGLYERTCPHHGTQMATQYLIKLVHSKDHLRKSLYFRIGTFSIKNFCSTTRSSARNIWVYLSQCTPSTTSTSWAAKRQAVLCCIVVEHQTNAALFKITNDKQITERTKECHVPTPNHDQPSPACPGHTDTQNLTKQAMPRQTCHHGKYLAQVC